MIQQHPKRGTCTVDTQPEVLTGKARVERTMRAKEQWTALKAWQLAGSPDGSRPETPDYDALQALHDNGGRAMAKAATTTGAGRSAASVTYCRGGKAIKRSRYFLGFMANDCTRHIGGDDVKRLTTEGFRDLLADAGVNDPENSTWQVTLSNGETVGAHLKGESLPKPKDMTGWKPKPGQLVRGATARKAKAATKAAAPPAKSAAAKKAPAKKVAAKKAGTTKMVTPIPKKGTAKKRSAAHTATRRTATKR